MTATAAVSVATFSTVLAEAFAAVTLTSVQTNLLIGGLRRARAQGRALAAMTTPPPVQPAPAPLPPDAPVTAANVGIAVGDVGVQVSSPVITVDGVPERKVRLDSAALHMFQYWASQIRSQGGIGFARIGRGLRSGAHGLGELVIGVARQIGMVVPPAAANSIEFARTVIARLDATLQGGEPVSLEVARLVEAVAGFGIDSDEVDLFVAKSAKIHAEFEFQASDEFRFRVGQTGEQSGGLGALQIVSLAPGFSALYQSSSRNRITLDVEFALTNVKL